MRVITFEGIVENGQIRLSGNFQLPEKAKVYVVVPDAKLPSPPYIASPRLVHQEQVEDFEKEVIEETRNASV